MEAAIIAILTQLGIQAGTDAAEFLTVFLGGFLKLRIEKGGQGLILPTLIHWWMIAAEDQRNIDGSSLTNDQKHAYVKNLITDWSAGVGLDLRESFKDALIKIGALQRTQTAGTEIVKIISQTAGDAIKHSISSAIGTN